MTLITAIVGGLLVGYFLGLRPRSFVTWIVLWAVVLTVQTIWVVPQEDTGDILYWPFQAGIFLIGMLMIWLGAKARARLVSQSDAGQ